MHFKKTQTQTRGKNKRNANERRFVCCKQSQHKQIETSCLADANYDMSQK